MKHLSSRLLAALAVLTVVAACSDEDLVYPNGPPGPAASLDIANTNVTVIVGETATVGAQLRDAAGNPRPETASITACDATVSVAPGTANEAYNTVVTVTGAALGESCLTVTAGDFSDSVGVTVGPAGIVIVGPDTIISAASDSYSIEFYDAGGNLLSGSAPVTWESSDLTLTQIDQSGVAVAPGPIGTLDLRARAAGGAAAFKTVRAVPGVFDGTIANTAGTTVTTASFGDTLIIKPGTVPFDGDEFVFFGSVLGWAISRNADSLVVMMPNALASEQRIVIAQQGPSQIYGATAFTMGTRFTAPALSTPFATSTTPERCNTGGTYTEFISLPANPTRALTAAGRTQWYRCINMAVDSTNYRVRIDWQLEPGFDGVDVDILWIDTGFTVVGPPLPNAAASEFDDGDRENISESLTVRIAAAGGRYIGINRNWFMGNDESSYAEVMVRVRIDIPPP